MSGLQLQQLSRRCGDRNVLDLHPDAADVERVPQALLTHHLAPIYGRGPDATPMAEQARA